jgi:hypothetical protein
LTARAAILFTAFKIARTGAAFAGPKPDKP